MAATSTKVAVVTVVAIRAAAVIKEVADADTLDKAAGVKVRTIKGTKDPTTKATRALVTKVVEAGPTTAGPTTRCTLHWYSLSLRTFRAFTTCPYRAPSP